MDRYAVVRDRPLAGPIQAREPVFVRAPSATQTMVRGDLLAIATVSLASVALLAIFALRYPLPLDFAGLYALMAEGIATNGYHLPRTVPYYGPGGLPFAYPPLGFYLMALCTHALGLPVFTYVRVAPVVFSGLALIPLSYLARRLAASRAATVLAVVYVAMATGLFRLQVEAGGVVRGLGFVLALSGVACAYTALARPRWRTTVLAAIFCALALLTHPAYAVFTGASVIAFTLAGRDWRLRLRTAALIGIMALIGAAPWWVTILGRGDLSGFGAVLHSQTSLTVALGLQVSSWASALRHPVGVVTLLHLLQLPALGYCLLRKRWTLPIWYLVATLLSHDERFVQDTIGAILLGLFFWEASGWISARARPADRLLLRRAMLALVALYPVAIFLHWAPRQRPGLTAADLAVGAWMRAHTPADARYLLAGPDAESETGTEWWPYLSHRTLAIAPWGAEWTGAFAVEAHLLAVQQRCVHEQSIHCLAALFAQAGGRGQAYLIVRHDTAFRTLTYRLQASRTWRQVYRMHDDTVWEHEGAPA